MTHDAHLRVRYAETDQMGVVYHSNYLIYFEVGRTTLLRHLGLDYKILEKEQGCYLAVVDVQCRYKAPARFDDELIIRTTITRLRGSLIRFEYRILRTADQVVLTEGNTTHLIVGLDLKRAPMPAYFAQTLELAHVAKAL